MATMKESSKGAWTSNGTVDHINAGSLQRIADACELMAKDHATLISSRDYQKERADRYFEWYKTEQRRVAALRGVITKMKREAEK